MKYNLLLLQLVLALPLISFSQDVTYDNVTITQQLGLTGGLNVGFSNDNIPHIYRSITGGSFPFNQNGNLVLQPRSSSARNIVFMTGTPTPFPRLTISHEGNVGIGVSYPSTKLEVSGLANYATLTLANENFIAFKRSDGKTVYGIGHTLGEFTIGSSANLGPTAGTPMHLATGGSYIKFSQGAQERMRVAGNGNVGIGTTIPDEKLTVKGTIHSEEVRVEVVGADFVFDTDYNLMPLAEIEAFVTQNHHLPEVPSAAEMQEDGLELGKMNILLLQKIEELTLHQIEQHKNIELLLQKVAVQEKEITDLKNKN